MKQSVFNSILQRGSEAVVFNSLTGALARLDAEGIIVLKGDAADDQIQYELAKAGFLVSDGFDEFALLEERFLADMNATDFLSLCISPTMQCNLRCPYCYEEHENVRITPEVEDAILHFIERRHERFGFKDLHVLWYGGEPTLEIDAMERLSARMIGWAESNGVDYKATMVTNATLVDDGMAKRLVDMQVRFAMPTIEACKDCHDTRRVHIDGSGSYDQTLNGAIAMGRAGIAVNSSCNTDKTAFRALGQLQDRLKEEPNVFVTPSHLRNYNGWPDSDEAKAGDFNLMSRREFADAMFEFYAAQNPTANSVYETLRFKRMFCQGKMASYFGIDPEGNVCRCDGRLRDPEYVMFNLLDDSYELDWPETLTISERNARCSECSIAPLCLGQCDWEWSMFKENCSPLKYNLDKYVWLLHDLMMEAVEADGGQVQILIPPRDIEAEYAKPFDIAKEAGLMG